MHVSRSKLFGTGTPPAMIGSGLLGPFILVAKVAGSILGVETGHDFIA